LGPAPRLDLLLDLVDGEGAPILAAKRAGNLVSNRLLMLCPYLHTAIANIPVIQMMSDIDYYIVQRSIQQMHPEDACAALRGMEECSLIDMLMIEPSGKE
jgi:hypothetical protein